MTFPWTETFGFVICRQRIYFFQFIMSIVIAAFNKDISKMVLDRWAWFSLTAFKLDCNVKNSFWVLLKSVFQNVASFQPPFVAITPFHLWIALENLVVALSVVRPIIYLGREELYNWLQKCLLYNMSTAVRYRKTNTEAAGYLDVRSTCMWLILCSLWCGKQHTSCAL